MVEELPSGEEVVPTPALLFCPYRSGDCLKKAARSTSLSMVTISLDA